MSDLERELITPFSLLLCYCPFRFCLSTLLLSITVSVLWLEYPATCQPTAHIHTHTSSFMLGLCKLACMQPSVHILTSHVLLMYAILFVFMFVRFLSPVDCNFLERHQLEAGMLLHIQTPPRLKNIFKTTCIHSMQICMFVYTHTHI